MNNIKLICFDLDDTLIREIHSVMLPCILNGKEEEHAVIQEKEIQGEMDYVSADYQRAALLEGLEEQTIRPSFLSIAKPLKHIGSVVKALHERDIRCIVITVGPKQVAKVVSDIWGFDGYYGSHYDVKDGVFTGRILDYVKSENKINCLQDYCKKYHIDPAECMAVGDGSTDIPLFEYCGYSIALNSSQQVKEKAMYAVDTDDLMDIMKYIEA